MNANPTANIKIKQVKTMYKNGVLSGIKGNKLGKKETTETRIQNTYIKLSTKKMKRIYTWTSITKNAQIIAKCSRRQFYETVLSLDFLNVTEKATYVSYFVKEL